MPKQTKYIFVVGGVMSSVGKGIAASRLEAKGFGATKAMASNATERGRARNRRVEFLVIGAD